VQEVGTQPCGHSLLNQQGLRRNRQPTVGRYVYADSALENGLSESFSIDGCEHTPYGASKLAADLYMQEYSRTYGLKTAVFRISYIYGTRQFGNEDHGFFAHFILSALRNRKITIYGDGKQLRDVLFVSDMIETYNAFLASILKGRLFNMGGGSENTLSLLELVGRIERMTVRRPDISFDKLRNGDQRTYISDTRHAVNSLAESPRWVLRMDSEGYSTGQRTPEFSVKRRKNGTNEWQVIITKYIGYDSSLLVAIC